MLFSSNIFLFIFLPVVLLIYYLPLRNVKIRNIFLLLASLFFYGWGEPKFVFILMLSILANYLFALWVNAVKEKGKAQARICLTCMIVFNLIIFFVFKYLTFTVKTIDSILGMPFTGPNIVLPIGISFFTFQAMSYVFDVYRNKGELQKNPLYVGLYITFFPQLIAGPIVRYQTISDQILHRKESWNDFAAGVNRFIVGLAKKVLLANTLALLADRAFSVTEAGGLSVSLAWLGMIAYTLQIYYDFSGYSDMAIGLGKMFGFHFDENFDHPYQSKSITEFWRRWHISLGTWFRDYVYIPLGGSKGLPDSRIAINLLIVWLLTGIWHGANWTFFLWGLFYYILLASEKLLLSKTSFYARIPKLLKWFFTILLVMLGWVLFRANDLPQAGQYYLSLFGLAGNSTGISELLMYLRENLFVLLAACIFSFPAAKSLRNWIEKRNKLRPIGDVFRVAMFVLIFIASVAYLVKGTYNPFIYFNF